MGSPILGVLICVDICLTAKLGQGHESTRPINSCTRDVRIECVSSNSRVQGEDVRALLSMLVKSSHHLVIQW